ncbi:MAG: ABC transporter substrate-binding protein [Poseidonibacter sp.]|uniref:ABC transporter substrate-binding protein n=2 Tax=Poseidonibacter sp. TaxID=2321188 RepID=UPI00359D95B2
MKNILKKIFLLTILILSLESKEIKIGMSADFSGPIDYLGNSMKTGIQTYLNVINKTSENKYKLITLDDKYNPISASKNVRKLINEEKVVAFLGNLGTPTANVTVPIVNENKIVSFGAYSGGGILRNPSSNEYIFNYRASYSQEAYYIILNLLKQGITPEEMAFFTQNDTYGDSGYYGAIKALRDSGYEDISKIVHSRYTRGTENIENALSKILESNKKIKIILMVSVDKPTIKFIKYAKDDFPDIKFFSLSPINTSVLIEKLGGYSKDIYITQVVPLLNSDLQIVKEFRENIKSEFPLIAPDFISLEGYIIAKLFIEGIKDIKNEDVNSQNIFNELNKLKTIDIGLGFESSFDKRTHQYSSKIWLTGIKNNEIVEVSWDSIFKSKD